MQKQKKTTPERPNLGKPMPSDNRIEQAVLGAILIDSSVFLSVQSSAFALEDADFYSDQNKAIWAAMCGVAAETRPIDLVTVAAELKRLNLLDICGGPYILVEISSRMASAANVEYYAALLKQLSIRRKVILQCSASIEAAYDDTADALDTLGDAQSGLADVSDGFGQNNVDLLKLTHDLYAQSTDPNFLKLPTPTGFSDLDLALQGGLYSDDFIALIGGRPGSGKTAFALGLVINKLRAGMPVAVFSYEMTAEALLRRLWSNHADIDHARIRTQNLAQWEIVQLAATRDWFAERAHLLHIFDCTGMPFSVLIAKITKAKADGIADIFIDHFGEIPRPEGMLEEPFNELKIRRMRNVAKTFGLRLHVLVQFRKLTNGAVASRPTMSDIKGSAAISECASVILFLHEEDSKRQVIIEKCRNAGVADVEMEYEGACFQWRSLGNGLNEQFNVGQIRPDLSSEQGTVEYDFGGSEW